jgi:hypothetical protein
VIELKPSFIGCFQTSCRPVEGQLVKMVSGEVPS